MYADGCRSLTNLDVSSFDTSNVMYMNGMFNFCSVLTNLDVSNFDTSNVTNMRGMFMDSSKLATIYATNGKWVTTQANTTNMFNGCGTDHVTYK